MSKAEIKWLDSPPRVNVVALGGLATMTCQVSDVTYDKFDPMKLFKNQLPEGADSVSPMADVSVIAGAGLVDAFRYESSFGTRYYLLDIKKFEVC